MRRLIKKLLVGLALLLLAGSAFFFLFASAIAERLLNAVSGHWPGGVSERARRLYPTLRIADLHADSLLWGRDLLARGRRGHVDIPRLIEGNVAIQGFSAVTQVPRGFNDRRNDARTDLIIFAAQAQRWPMATWGSLKERAVYQAARLRQVAERSGGRFTLVKTRADLAGYLERRRRETAITAGFLAVEGAHAIHRDPSDLDVVFEAGFRVIGLAHFFDNQFGGSSSGIGKGGLTAAGRELIRRMEARGMIVDLAHASPRTIKDVLALAARPVVVSHTGVKGTCETDRNIRDEDIRGVARTGGVIGIGYWKGAVCGDDARAVARAIRYAATMGGIRHVGLGSDFDGAVAAPFDTTSLVYITEALLAEGFGEEEIRMIMGENVLRMLSEGLP